MYVGRTWRNRGATPRLQPLQAQLPALTDWLNSSVLYGAGYIPSDIRGVLPLVVNRPTPVGCLLSADCAPSFVLSPHPSCLFTLSLFPRATRGLSSHYATNVCKARPSLPPVFVAAAAPGLKAGRPAKVLCTPVLTSGHILWPLLLPQLAAYIRP